MSRSDETWRPRIDADTLVQKSVWLGALREYFREQNVIEVHTPLLGPATVTDPDLNALQVQPAGFLQTSPEYYLKRLLAAGVPSCYQLLPCFRAEEHGRHHNAEFLMLEWYRLDFDHHDLMRDVSRVVDIVLGEGRYETVTYLELVGSLKGERAELDLRLAEACARLKGRWFITDYPADQAALARLNDDGETAARFELVVDGVELANGYWELADAQQHLSRFVADNVMRATRGSPTVNMDQAFLDAIAHGLPDCAGVALGVDRLFMLGLGVDSLDQVLSFRD